ncbi:N-acetylmuramoyl-L-alanine amidase family protein [Nocardioides bruguierae]|uniref:N-acetylmuramoyl-L-alanine amidase n=1 Tax=Nocardioides bruguierae TaxID=2945102 RepID=A0A9X2IGI9_9ACTN|nr:N-acetylmuramoyl-L-alanine amidase [Nocardioides bruguierae]MCM0622417.1 N-acetylmuramoyl-L-alanine amidase [Nocardioides bruguierae]
MPRLPHRPAHRPSPRTLGRAVAAPALAGALVLGLAPAAPALPSSELATSGLATAVSAAQERKPLAGVTVVLDPGHQLGNKNFPEEINRLVQAGGFKKACNTTGTATNKGWPEATFVWQLAVRTRRKLRRLGATVRLTRHSNREDRWGPCINTRGKAGARYDADVLLSLHGDGSTTSGARGFHVIRPTKRKGWTGDIWKPSRRLARTLKRAMKRQGFPVANYVAGGTGIDARGDLGTLNLSDVPAVLLEAGNMRNRRDARAMRRTAGQRRYAAALVATVRRFTGN